MAKEGAYWLDQVLKAGQLSLSSGADKTAPVRGVLPAQHASRLSNGLREHTPSFQSETVASATSTRNATQAVRVPMMAAAIQPEASSKRLKNL